MRSVFIILLMVFSLSAKPFTVATYNVENLFDAVYDGTEYEEYIPGRHGWNKRTAQMKLNHTAEVICDIDADIIALQEVENEAIFKVLRKRLQRVGCGYRYGAISHKKGAPVQVAMLSRFPIVRQNELQVSYAPRVRNILEVSLKVEGVRLTLFVNHWKSKGRKGYESKRLAYAHTLAKRIANMPEGKEYIILGDLNTNYDAYLTLPKRLNDTNSLIGLNHLLHTVKKGELLHEADMMHGKRNTHYDLWLELPFSKRWSYKFYGRKSTVDHILLPPTMFDGKGIDYVNDSFMVFKRSYLFTKKGYINRWQVRAGRHTGRGYSDHLPLIASFDTNPYVPSKKEYVQKSIKGTIDSLYAVEHLESPIVLEDAIVVLKRGRYAVLKQMPKGRGIFVFGAVRGLREGEKYDLKVQEISTYKGLKEITAMVKLSSKGHVSLQPFYVPLSVNRQNEVVRDLEGVYEDHYFHIHGKKFPIHFRNQRLTPPNGTKLKIAYAHLGYYKKLQLVIYSKKDFTILEN